MSEDTTTGAVLAIVRQVLDDPGVGLDDDLFDAGFDSLVVVRTAARVRERLGVDLPLGTYFDAATVTDRAAAVERAR